MRVLFQGAGAIGLAGAALFTDAHEVAVAGRAPASGPRASYPRRVGRPEPGGSTPEGARAGQRATEVAATRRVTVTDWAGAAGVWDLVVLSTRPGDLDPAVASAIREIAPKSIAITSQVEGDLDRARSEFPAAEVVVLAPMFLSERLGEEAAPDGREVRYWAPADLPRFLLAGQREAVRRLVRGLGRLVLPAPIAAAVVPPAVFIPYVAELSIHGGNWARLKAHLHRPTQAAAEAVRARLGLPVPMSAVIARGVLEAIEFAVPIDVTAYAGRHFGRHVDQTRNMLTGWGAGTNESPALEAQIAALNRPRH
ncbi:hypothetical protein [Brevibacterium renqingii]|uniref:hypothetical protein n=1 Tax=Brevibacterium renqingii TaxID=2776916 RepID=UPI001AE0D57B|nr:hypothetical protein [Brevibacterium renqingii]